MRVSATALLCLLSAGWGNAQVPEGQESRLIKWISGPQLAAKAAALTDVLRLSPQERGPRLERVIADELLRVDGDLRRRDLLARQNKPDYPSEALLNYYGLLVQAASKSVDPLMIPALARALPTGPLVIQALARFGDQAFPDVETAARDLQNPDPFGPANALRVMKAMLEATPTRLSAVTRQRIQSLAVERLRGGAYDPTVVKAACELGVATGDPALRLRVMELATQSTAVRTMGVTDNRRIADIQKAARRALEIKR